MIICKNELTEANKNLENFSAERDMPASQKKMLSDGKAVVNELITKVAHHYFTVCCQEINNLKESAAPKRDPDAFLSKWDKTLKKRDAKALAKMENDLLAEYARTKQRRLCNAESLADVNLVRQAEEREERAGVLVDNTMSQGAEMLNGTVAKVKYLRSEPIHVKEFAYLPNGPIVLAGDFKTTDELT